MSDAERQAQRAGEFDEAAAMRRESGARREHPFNQGDLFSMFGQWYRVRGWVSLGMPMREITLHVELEEAVLAADRPPAADLERALAEIDAAPNDDAVTPLGPEHLSSKLGLILLRWPTIRAALRERRELREALENAVEPAHTHRDVAGGGYSSQCLGCVHDDGFQAGWLASARSRLAQSAAGEERERG